MSRTWVVSASVAFLVSCSGSDLGALDAGSAPLTADQCASFATHGKVTICHATHSAKNPFVVIRVSERACTEGHAGHPDDFVAVDDPPTCQGLGCLPEDAPCDETLGCCDGLACTEGTCEPVLTPDPTCAEASEPCETNADCCPALLCLPAGFCGQAV